MKERRENPDSNDRLELLAPAGNMEQALMSIEAGCNAVYGGLKKWNARMNACNFSVDEYKKLLSICHQHGVKFYLTLNTLFKDSELDEITELFENDDFILPDAVIAADMGIISILSKKFPSVDIHASTQFGASSLQDILFLQKYNVKRVILARELTLTEIREIRSKTDIEIEVFVYGSQCLCFSGQCLWGGLTQERSGNRGRCPATCRDFYICKDKSGQLLYPQDIDAKRLVKGLESIGINSIKIEGRFRDSKQIASVVNAFRRAIDDDLSLQKDEMDKIYEGYLGDQVPVEGMLGTLNPRTKLFDNKAFKYGKNDFLAVAQTPKSVIVKTGNDIDAELSDKKYIKTIFSEPLSKQNDGAVLTLKFEDGILEKVDCTDNIGNQFSCSLNGNNIQATTVSDISAMIFENAAFKIMELTSNEPQYAEVYCDNSEMLKIVATLNTIVKQVPKPQATASDLPDSRDIIQITSAETMQMLKNKGFHNFIFNITSVEELKKVIFLEDESDSVIYKIPLLDFTHKTKTLLTYLRGKRIMISKWSQLLLKDIYDFKEVYADYTLNVWNSEAASILAGFGVIMFIAHPEMSLQENVLLSKKNSISSAVIYIGRIPIGFTRACFGEMGLCSGECGNTDFELENATKKYNIRILCNNDRGYRTITTSVINAAYGKTGDCRRIFDLSQMTDEEIQLITSEGINDKLQISSIYGRSVL